MTEEQIKHLVRIANTDMKGTKQILYGLKNVKGVGIMFANAICQMAKIPTDKKAGVLSDDEIKRIEAIIKDPLKYNFPNWMLNRRKDMDTGEDKHISTGDLKFTIETDIKQMKKIKSYRGVRHMFGLPVRGQRTRSNFRPNKGKVKGVQKKKVGKKGGK
ncbi:30S ribosomal protein S13 [Candidatus Woesearchaeota archaeon]|nr:30S ribosomal protein S13 [Candidatus Woesearchaeota archaeon]